MDENLRHQRDTSLGRLEALMRRGRQLGAAPSADATRDWQRECAAAINQLSGGSKAHWLARAFSAAFLVRAADGGVLVEADTGEIVARILDVLAQGAASLSRMDAVEAASSGQAPRPRRFEFVHNAALRPLFEQAFDDGARAFEDGHFALALTLACGLIEALLTDALEAGGSRRVADWSFDERIGAAERDGLIRGGCARLPAAARRYKDLSDASGQLRPAAEVSERDARVARQVLHVVMRDLDPGR
jgi:hypothetical protein